MEVIGVSPTLVANLSWYKDLDYSYAATILDQFKCKQHCLISTEFGDGIREISSNQKLEKNLIKFRALIMELKLIGSSREIIQKFIQILENIIEENEDLGDIFIAPLLEVIEFLKIDQMVAKNVSSLHNFSKAWGRGQQYISLIKEFK